MTTTPLSYGAIINSKINSQFAVDTATTTGLTFGYRSGDYAFEDIEINTAAGTVSLSDDTTQAVRLEIASGIVSIGISDEEFVELYQITTASGVITNIVDRRAAYV